MLGGPGRSVAWEAVSGAQPEIAGRGRAGGGVPFRGAPDEGGWVNWLGVPFRTAPGRLLRFPSSDGPEPVGMVGLVRGVPKPSCMTHPPSLKACGVACRYPRGHLEGPDMLGEIIRRKQIGKILSLLGYGGEEVLGWDSGDVLVTAGGRSREMKGLLVATPTHVFLLDQRTSQGMAMPWHVITDAETRQDTWKTSFILHTTDGGSVALRTSAPRPVQTLIADWVTADRRDRRDPGQIGAMPNSNEEATPPEWKLQFAISMVGNVLRPVLGDLPEDPRVRGVVVTLSETIHHLALAHIERLRGEKGWEARAREAWRTTASVERTVVLYHDVPPFDGLATIELSVESVADGLMNASGTEQEKQRRSAVELAVLAKNQLEGTSGPYLKAAARGALLLAEGSFATQPPADK